jgi:hypothetical protein
VKDYLPYLIGATLPLSIVSRTLPLCLIICLLSPLLCLCPILCALPAVLCPSPVLCSPNPYPLSPNLYPIPCPNSLSSVPSTIPLYSVLLSPVLCFLRRLYPVPYPLSHFLGPTGFPSSVFLSLFPLLSSLSLI